MIVCKFSLIEENCFVVSPEGLVHTPKFFIASDALILLVLVDVVEVPNVSNNDAGDYTLV